MVLDAQLCQASAWALQVNMLFILHTVPVAFSADSKLVRDLVLLLPEQLNIKVVTRESKSGESA